MDAEAVLAWIDTLALRQTGQRLNDLQRTIVQKVWQGKKYVEIAAIYGCTEGHVKDVASDLWKFLSSQLGERITKSNCRSTLVKHVQVSQTVRTRDQGAGGRGQEPFNIQRSTFNIQHSPTPSPLTPHPSLFVGRASAIAHLNALVQQGSNVIVIQGKEVWEKRPWHSNICKHKTLRWFWNC